MNVEKIIPIKMIGQRGIEDVLPLPEVIKIARAYASCSVGVKLIDMGYKEYAEDEDEELHAQFEMMFYEWEKDNKLV